MKDVLHRYCSILILQQFWDNLHNTYSIYLRRFTRSPLADKILKLVFWKWKNPDISCIIFHGYETWLLKFIFEKCPCVNVALIGWNHRIKI